MAGPGVLCGRICHITSKFLAGGMPKLVGNPQEYVYYVPESSGAAFGVNKSQYTCITFHLPPVLYGRYPMWFYSKMAHDQRGFRALNCLALPNRLAKKAPN